MNKITYQDLFKKDIEKILKKIVISFTSFGKNYGNKN